MSRKDFQLYKIQINNSLNVNEATAVSEFDNAKNDSQWSRLAYIATRAAVRRAHFLRTNDLN